MKKYLLFIPVLILGAFSAVIVANASVSNVSAGADQEITWPTSNVNLVGSATAGDGKSIASYAWTQTSGPVSGTITTPSTAATSVTGLTTPGTYVFSLTATDNSTPAESAASSMSVVVKPGITVSAGANKTITLPTTSVTLNGTASTSPGNAIASYLWTQTSGPVTATIVNSTNASTSITGLSSTGTYVFKLTATNNGTPALSANSSVTVNVNSINVSAGADQTITLPTSSVNLSGTASTSEGSITSYAWTQTSGPVSGTITTPSTAATSVTGLTTAGVYVFKLTASNNGSPVLSGNDSMQVTVNPNPNNNGGQQTGNKPDFLHINQNGKVKLRGEMVSNSNNIMTIKVFGMTFTINTGNAQFVGTVTDQNSFSNGDTIKVKGVLDQNASTPTVNAAVVKDVTKFVKPQSNNSSNNDNDDDGDEDNDDHKSRIQELKDKWKDAKKDWQQAKKESKGHGKNKGKKNGRGHGWDD